MRGFKAIGRLIRMRCEGGASKGEPLQAAGSRSSHLGARLHRWMGRPVATITVINLLALGGLWILRALSERWWISTIVTYVPTYPFALPGILLLACSIKWHRPSIALNLISTLLVVGPLMEFRLPGTSALQPPVSTEHNTFTLFSCNVESFNRDFSCILADIVKADPDVVALQEVRGEESGLETFFEDWYVIHVGEFWVGSKYPVRHRGVCHDPALSHASGIQIEICAPTRRFLLFNIHLTSPHRAFKSLTPAGILSGAARQEIERRQSLRDREAATVRSYIEASDDSLPKVVVGDFNVPSSSSLYRKHWNGWANAFDTAGRGYGYTAPCPPIQSWFARRPGLRIDHILIGPNGDVKRCSVGTPKGSDHRPIMATLVLIPPDRDDG